MLIPIYNHNIIDYKITIIVAGAVSPTAQLVALPCQSAPKTTDRYVTLVICNKL